jgi:hypothetical protein
MDREGGPNIGFKGIGIPYVIYNCHHPTVYMWIICHELKYWPIHTIHWNYSTKMFGHTLQLLVAGFITILGGGNRPLLLHHHIYQQYVPLAKIANLVSSPTSKHTTSVSSETSTYWR